MNKRLIQEQIQARELRELEQYEAQLKAAQEKLVLNKTRDELIAEIWG